jgi:predicted O-methyltransferase YrrM
MTELEQDFLNGLIRKYKPKKVLEVGISKGGSSAIILNAIKDIPGAKLHSIDKEKMCYSMKEKETGFLVADKFPDLVPLWDKRVGGLVSDFIESIGSNIDFLFLDTMHVMPGEMLDFLMALPFLKPGAIVCVQGIGSHFGVYDKGGIVRKLNYSSEQLFCNMRGTKFLPQRKDHRKILQDTFSNIGACRLHPYQNNYLFEYFYPLTFQCEYLPNKDQLNSIRTLFKKNYDAKYVDIFEKAISTNQRLLARPNNTPKDQDSNKGE